MRLTSPLTFVQFTLAQWAIVSTFDHPATEHHLTTLNFAEQMFSVVQSKCSVRLTGAKSASAVRKLVSYFYRSLL